MKTTVEISPPLLLDAKRLARERGTTLRALIEDGLRHVLGAAKQPQRPFRLAKASVGGRGLQDGLREGDWNQLRERIYEGRGG